MIVKIMTGEYAPVQLAVGMQLVDQIQALHMHRSVRLVAAAAGQACTPSHLIMLKSGNKTKLAQTLAHTSGSLLLVK